MTHTVFLLDFDGDNYLGKEDIAKTVTSLTKNDMTPEETNFVCEKVAKLLYIYDCTKGTLQYNVLFY